jgi:hypothetical protein
MNNQNIILQKTVITKTSNDTQWWVKHLVPSSCGKWTVPVFTMNVNDAQDFSFDWMAHNNISNFHPGTPGLFFIEQVQVELDAAGTRDEFKQDALQQTRQDIMPDIEPPQETNF